MIAKFHKVWHR